MTNHLTLLLTIILSCSAVNQDFLEQAKSNYQEILNGQKQLSQLSPKELAELRAFVELLSRRTKALTPAERCVADELRRSGGSPTALHQQIIDLKCREVGGR
jgi:hypothetical protein